MRLGVVLSRVALACLLCSVVLLGSRLASPALAQSTSTQTSMLVFPIFDVIGGNLTKISITNNGGSVLLVRLTFVCEASDVPPATARVCKAVEEMVAFAAHETHVFDVATELTTLGLSDRAGVYRRHGGPPVWSVWLGVWEPAGPEYQCDRAGRTHTGLLELAERVLPAVL